MASKSDTSATPRHRVITHKPQEFKALYGSGSTNTITTDLTLRGHDLDKGYWQQLGKIFKLGASPDGGGWTFFDTRDGKTYIRNGQWQSFIESNIEQIAHALFFNGLPQIVGFEASGFHQKSTSDFVNHNFKKRSSNGQVINTPFSSSEDNIVVNAPSPFTDVQVTNHSLTSPVYPGGYVLEYYCTWTVTITYVVPQQVPLVPAGLLDWVLDLAPASSSARDSAVSEAFTNARTAEVQGLVNLHEIEDTYSLITSKLKQVWSLLRNLLRFRFDKIYRDLRRSGVSPVSLGEVATDFSAAWVQTRYGILPLMYELEALGKELSRVSRPVRKTFRAFRSTSEDLDVDEVVSINGSDYIVRGLLETTHQYRAGVLTQLDKSGVAHKSALGFYDLGTAFWETVPFSFVLDWFVNTSAIFSRLNIKPTYKSLTSWVTIQTNVKGVLQVSLASDPQSIATISVDRTLKDRTPDPEEPFLSFYPMLTWKRLIDAGALLRLLSSKN